MKKYLALSLAALLLLCFAVGCSLTTGDPEASPTPAVTDESDSTYDLTAVVAEIGDEKITLGEVKETFDSYISYFTNYGYDLSSDPEMRAMLLDDVVNSLVEAKLISSKPMNLGMRSSMKKSRLSSKSGLNPSWKSWMPTIARRQKARQKATPTLMWMNARWS